MLQFDNWSNEESWQGLGSRYLKIRSAIPIASLLLADLHLVHALGLEAPSKRLLDRLRGRALDSSGPIFVPRWNRPAGPAVDGGNGSGQGVDVGDDPPAQPGDSGAADASQTAKEGKERTARIPEQAIISDMDTMSATSGIE